MAVYRVTTGTWYVRDQFVMILGGQPVPGDYDGDGTDGAQGGSPTHRAVVLRGRFVGTVYGPRGDVPVPRDYNGDGVTDLAVYQPSTRTWIVRGLSTTQFGEAAELVVPRAPIPRASPGDYDGDTGDDVGVYRPSTTTGSSADPARGPVLHQRAIPRCPPTTTATGSSTSPRIVRRSAGGSSAE